MQHCVETQPFVIAKRNMFVILNQSLLKRDNGSNYMAIAVVDPMKTALNIERVMTKRVPIIILPPRVLPIVSQTLKIIIIIKKNQVYSLFIPLMKPSFESKKTPGKITNVTQKTKNRARSMCQALLIFCLNILQKFSNECLSASSSDETLYLILPLSLQYLKNSELFTIVKQYEQVRRQIHAKLKNIMQLMN